MASGGKTDLSRQICKQESRQRLGSSRRLIKGPCRIMRAFCHFQGGGGAQPTTAEGGRQASVCLAGGPSTRHPLLGSSGEPNP